MKIIIAGAGDVGKTLVNMLSSEKHSVSIIEIDEEKAKSIAKDTDALVIEGDSTDIAVLKDAGIEYADALIAVTNDDKTNLMACEIAKSMSTDKIISCVNNPENEQLFTKLGISDVAPVVDLIVTRIDNLLKTDIIKKIKLMGELDKGKVEVLQVKLDDTSVLIDNETIMKNAIVGAIYRDGEILLPTDKTKFMKGDVLTIITKAEYAEDTKKLASGTNKE